MAEQHAASSKALVSANVGRPKKLSQPCSSAMKRVYITAETCAKFREVKKANGFASDECTLQYLLNCNKKRYLQVSAIATDDPGATPPPPPASPLQLYSPVLCSTPSRIPLSTRPVGQQLVYSDEILERPNTHSSKTVHTDIESCTGYTHTMLDEDLAFDKEVEYRLNEASRIMNEETSSSETDSEKDSSGSEEFLGKGDKQITTSMLEHIILSAVEEGTLSALEEDTLSALEESTLSAIEEGTLSALEEDTLSAVEEDTLSAVEEEERVASVAVSSTTPEEETGVSQGQSVGSSHNPSTEELFKPTRFICSLYKLLELAAGVCDVENCGSRRNIDYSPSGCCVSIFGTCTNGHPFHWESSDKLGTGDQRKLYIDNVHFASAIVLSGNNYSKMELFARFYHLNVLRSASFYGYQRNYVCPGVDRFYKHQQDDLLTKFKDKELVLAGDGRCDSPGNSAKFCTYSVMDVDSCTVLHTETVDKRQVELHSPNMERKAFIKSMDFLLPRIKFTEIITDASSSIRKELATRYSNIFHSRMCGINPRNYGRLWQRQEN